MNPFAHEGSLRRRILGVLAAAAPVAAMAAAGCGDGQTCQSCFCGAQLPPAPTFDVTYTVCSPLDVDAASDAATDASDAAADDAADDAAGDAAGDAAVADAAADDAAPDAAPTQCFSDCTTACESKSTQGPAMCKSETGDGGVRVAHCQVQYLCGRRFDGLEEAAPAGSFGETLARMAWLEAASIRAFRRLARELRAHGAPRELASAARACARDEARHARAMSRLARLRGASVPRVEGEPATVRDLESIARENAVEACVGETFGALLALWQAERADDPDVRDAMRDIAPDELRHAAFGWAVAEWAEARLDASARQRIEAAKNEAIRDLLQNANGEERRLAIAMRDAVWS